MLHVQDEEAFSLQDSENQESAADSIENDLHVKVLPRLQILFAIQNDR